MEALFERQNQMLRATSMEIVRSYMDTINWQAPMLCIRGARGVGKSTLLRQYVKSHFPQVSEEVLYCSLDWGYFTQHSLLDVAEKFHKRGGKLLILDEAHKYPQWSREVKEIAEVFPDMQLMLSGSSMLRLLDGDADLSRRCVSYEMHGLSFREYLQFYKGIQLEKHSLKEVLENAKEIAAKVNDVCRPLQYFHDYLCNGYYPYYLKNPINYHTLIEQTANYIVDVELPQLRGVNPANCRKVKSLLCILAQLVPFEVDITKLASMAELQRNTVLEYLNYLQDAKLISLLYSDLKSVKKMKKPDKIYLDNPNMLYALSTDSVQIGTARECFAVNQLSCSHTVEYGKTSGDFKVDGTWTFEVGGQDKSFKQIADIPNSFILADDIEYPIGNKLPLWMLGLLY